MLFASSLQLFTYICLNFRGVNLTECAVFMDQQPSVKGSSCENLRKALLVQPETLQEQKKNKKTCELRKLDPTEVKAYDVCSQVL